MGSSAILQTLTRQLCVILSAQRIGGDKVNEWLNIISQTSDKLEHFFPKINGLILFKVSTFNIRASGGPVLATHVTLYTMCV